MKTMKGWFTFVLIIALSNLFAQTSPVQKSPPQVSWEWVTDGANVSLSARIESQLWDDVREEMLKQVSKEQFENIRTYSRIVPCEMQVWCGGNFDRKKNLDSLTIKMSKLKTYKVATFHQTIPGDGTVVKYAVIAIPYAGNENWDENVTWDTAYFLIPDKYLVEVTPLFKQKASPARPVYHSVKINKAENAIFQMDEDFWNWTTDDKGAQIARQIGLENSTLVRAALTKQIAHSSYSSAFLPSSYKDKQAYNEAIKRLNAFKVASYITSAGKKYTIVRVPYHQNQNWNTEVKWDTKKSDTLFLILPDEDVEESGSKEIYSLK